MTATTKLRVLTLIQQAPYGVMVAVCECGRRITSAARDADEADRFDDELERHRADCSAARAAVTL